MGDETMKNHHLPAFCMRGDSYLGDCGDDDAGVGVLCDVSPVSADHSK